MEEIVKTCIKCGETKPLGMFVKQRLSRLGRCNTCKKCGSAYNMRKYYELPVEQRKKSPLIYQKQKVDGWKQIFEHYGSSCACCGESEPKFLTVDHINPVGSKTRHATGQARMFRWLRLHGWPKGFRILCSNCNSGRYRNGGICPHQAGSQTIAQASSSKRSEAPDVPLRDDDMVESLPKGEADLTETFHDNPSWPFASDRVQ